jgi:hypothetical protein
MFTGNMTWIGQVTRDSWGNRDGGSGQQANQVTRVVWGNRDSNSKSVNSSRVNRVGKTEQKAGGSSQVVNTESRVAENSANMESRAIKHSVNMEHRVM